MISKLLYCGCDRILSVVKGVGREQSDLVAVDSNPRAVIIRIFP